MQALCLQLIIVAWEIFVIVYVHFIATYYNLLIVTHTDLNVGNNDI